MFIVTAKLRRRRLLLIAAALLLLAALVSALRGCAASRQDIPAGTNEERVAYLSSLGWEVAPEPIETLSVTLGETLGEPYLSYNELQKSQGFDLTRCCGKTLSRYTYVVTNYPDGALPCQANLYVCESIVAAGDIVCIGEGGFIAELTFPDAEK